MVHLFIHRHVVAMPDVHVGIGSVIATDKAIIPATVGVDIGCGMAAVRTSLTAERLDERELKRVFDQISRDVPVVGAQHTDARAASVMVPASRVDKARGTAPGAWRKPLPRRIHRDLAVRPMGLDWWMRCAYPPYAPWTPKEVKKKKNQGASVLATRKPKMASHVRRVYCSAWRQL